VGLLYGIAAYAIWGVIPLYFKAVESIPAFELLMHRIVWSAVLLVLLLTLTGRWGTFQTAITQRKTLTRLLCSTLFIGCNWYVFIYSVVSHQTVQGSLGYFILPLVNVAFGMVIFHERLRQLQGVALGLAGLGVVILVIWSGVFPWISLILAVSFTIYGVLRKSTPVDPLVGLSIETLLLTPFALAMLLYWGNLGTLHFTSQGWELDLLILFSGLVTTVPLICYGQAVKRLQLITIGFLQYISPSIALMIAIFAFREPFSLAQQVSFGLIWVGLLLFTLDAAGVGRRSLPTFTTPQPSVPACRLR
jgi:chloramphenicol-sensitive protein RarD